MNMDSATATHKFELAGLGKAPFRYVGFEALSYQACPGAPIQGGSCDYCGTGITQAFWVESSDGRRFKVGCDCILKVGDRGLKRHVDAHKRKRAAEQRANKAQSVKSELTALLTDANVRSRLAAMPHPRGWTGQTMLDQVEWFARNAGAQGRAKILKEIKGVLK